jgi:hypothetical protein
MWRILPVTFALFFAYPTAVFCQESRPDPAQRFLILDTQKVETLQKEINEAAAGGYRVIHGDAAQKRLVLEKVSQPTPQPDYQVLWILQNQLKKASAEGFRVVQTTVGRTDFPGAVIERTPNSAAKYDYLIVDAGRTATFEREIVEGIGKGYRIVGMASGDTGHSAVLERDAGGDAGTSSTAPSSDQFKLIATNQSSTLQKELSDHAARGYRVRFASAAKETLLLLEKPPDAKDNVEYLVVSTTKSDTLQKELNDAAQRGFRLLPRTITAVQKRLLLGRPYGYEIGAIMEKVSVPGSEVEYLVLGAARSATLAKELSAAAVQGYGVVRLKPAYEETVIVLERPRAR